MNAKMREQEAAARKAQEEADELRAQLAALEREGGDAHEMRQQHATDMAELMAEHDKRVAELEAKLDAERKMKNSWVCAAQDGEKAMRSRIAELEAALAKANEDNATARR